MSKFWIIALVVANLAAVSLSAPTSTVKAFVCPPNETIEPCTCQFSNNSFAYEVDCKGEGVTQKVLDDLFIKLRQANGLKPQEILEFNKLNLFNPFLLTSLNLSFAAYSKISEFYCSYAFDLTSIVPWTEGQPERSIDVRLLSMASNGFTDAGFGNALRYFSTNLESLYLPTNQFVGGNYPIGDGSGDVEFLQGLSAFTNLRTLSFYSNPIRKLSGGQFKRLPRLTNIDLDWIPISQDGLGKDAFAVNTTSPGVILYFARADITEQHFSNINSTGLTSPDTAFYIYLTDNLISTLERNVFEPFLLAHPQNTMDLEGNPLICDGRLSWLKNKASDYSSRVVGATCKNGNGESIWESELIP